MTDNQNNTDQQNPPPQNESAGQAQQALDPSVVNAAPLHVAPDREAEDVNVVKLSDDSVEIPVGDEDYGSISTSDLRPVGEDSGQ